MLQQSTGQCENFNPTGSQWANRELAWWFLFIAHCLTHLDSAVFSYHRECLFSTLAKSMCGVIYCYLRCLSLAVIQPLWLLEVNYLSALTKTSIKWRKLMLCRSAYSKVWLQGLERLIRFVWAHVAESWIATLPKVNKTVEQCASENAFTLLFCCSSAVSSKHTSKAFSTHLSTIKHLIHTNDSFIFDKKHLQVSAPSGLCGLIRAESYNFQQITFHAANTKSF